MSDISSICTGVPQDAVAVPLLFNLFTADQPTTPNIMTLMTLQMTKLY